MTKVMRLLAMVCLAIAMAGGGAAHSAFASGPQTLTVSTCDEAHLDAAVATANADNAGDTINFGCSGTITLTKTLTISGGMTIDGSGQNVVIDGGHTSTTSGVQIMTVSPGVTLALTDLTLSDGEAADGGAIYNNGTLTITNSTLLSDDSADYGGAVYNAAGSTLVISDSTLSGDGGESLGTIFNWGTATITGSTFSNDQFSAIMNAGGTVAISSTTFSGNRSLDESGGAIDNESGTVAVSNSTFSSNTSRYHGGAIWNDGGTLTIRTSTFYDNYAAFFGGAIANTGTATILSSSFSGNSAQATDPQAIANYGPLAIGGSILADAGSGNCETSGAGVVPITDLGYNLEWSGSGNPNTCISSSVTTDRSGDPELGDLADNGGPTETMALGSTSPALDQIPAGTSVTANGSTYALCPSSGVTATDQRGEPRPDNGEAACDIGAYEFQDTTTTYTGTQLWILGAGGQTWNLSATVSPAACAGTGTFSYTLDRDPTTGASGSYTLSAVSPPTLSWQEGVYTLTATYTPSAGSACTPSSDTATLTIGGTGDSANGGGFVAGIPGYGRVSFGFTVQTVPQTTPSQYKGQFVMVNPGGWRVKGTLSSYTKTGSSGAAAGTGTVEQWDSTTLTWEPVASGVDFTISFTDNGTGGKKGTADLYGQHISLSGPPSFTPIAIKGGNITAR